MSYKAKILTSTSVALLLVSILLMGVGILIAEDKNPASTEDESKEAEQQNHGNTIETLGLAFGAALAVGLCAIGTAYAQAKIGSAGMGALAERPELVGPVIIGIAIPETMVILGFVTATIIVLMLKGG